MNVSEIEGRHLQRILMDYSFANDWVWSFELFLESFGQKRKLLIESAGTSTPFFHGPGVLFLFD